MKLNSIFPAPTNTEQERMELMKIVLQSAEKNCRKDPTNRTIAFSYQFSNYFISFRTTFEYFTHLDIHQAVEILDWHFIHSKILNAQQRTISAIREGIE